MPQSAQPRVASVVDEGDRKRAAVVEERDGEVTRKSERQADRRVHRPGRCATAHPILTRYVNGSAVTAFGRWTDVAGEPAGPAGRVDDHVACQGAAVDRDAGGAAVLPQQRVDVTRDERDAVLCLSRAAEHPLDDHSPAQQGNGPVVGRCRDRRSCCGQFVQHVWHFVLQHLDDLPAEGVGLVELHDSAAPPRGIDARGRRSRIAVDHEHVVPAPGQRDRGEQTGRARPDDDGSHVCPPL